MMDTNKDGRISLEENRNIIKRFGNEKDEELIVTVFEMYRRGDMPIDSILEAWTDFVAGDDPHNRSKFTDCILSKVQLLLEYNTEHKYPKIAG